jgi:hypothetical protein
MDEWDRGNRRRGGWVEVWVGVEAEGPEASTPHEGISWQRNRKPGTSIRKAGLDSECRIYQSDGSFNEF